VFEYILITNFCALIIIIYSQNNILLYMFRASSASSSWGYSCIHAAYGTVTLYESSWWPVGTLLEWEL